MSFAPVNPVWFNLFQLYPTNKEQHTFVFREIQRYLLSNCMVVQRYHFVESQCLFIVFQDHGNHERGL